ncbi:hypothetical protein GALMADRAFT_234981 [Galerina marginata CBS 339.88]|uniref:Novel STAND NTPase 1 domain-containing protein n=1 Tax=Galerina marginata (strain CBS 339.88) TaxID=685588 RepID=A0A067TRQ3_GALM3|nr:hypothetical protein GALMADRAFT_234981 [Galerina marginata CBS 339.88]
MSAGCFSWCPLPSKRSSKKNLTETKTKSDEKQPETQLAVVPKTKEYGTTANSNHIMTTKFDQESSENIHSVIPTTTQYMTASAKEVLSVLQSAAGIIPVPLLQESIEVALKIIEVCEEASAVESKVKEIQDRVGHLMVVIVAHVTAKNEEGSREVVVKAAKGIEGDIKGLLSTLGTINEDLKEISEQNRWVIAVYRELNTSTLEDCINRLSTALEKFKLSNDLRDSDLLQELNTRLEKMANKVDDISRDVKHAVARIEEFHDLLERSAMIPRTDTVARQQIPLKPEVFHGRDSLVDEIVQLLGKEETSRVCILGPGGMGKTSVSLAVVESPLVQERFAHGNYVWVPCNGATSAALLLETMHIQLQVPGDKQVTLEKIISELNTSTNPRLLILDNFETPWNAPGGSQKQVEDILRTLAKLDHIAMLVTMRGNRPPCYNAIKWQSKNIEPTDEESCLSIFHDINPSSQDDPDVGHLVGVLGHMPFAVTLMASLAEDGHSTAKELLDAWSESGPDLLSENPEQSMNRSISLSVDSDLVKRNPNAILLLSILSLLPAGTTKDNLRWWAPALKTSSILSATATLSKAGLLLENRQKDTDSPVLFVVPVVQSFMQHSRIEDELRNQIRLSCCRYVLDHAYHYGDAAFSIKSKALAAEDTNIQSILFGSSTRQRTHLSDEVMEALIAFCWHRCDTKPSLEMATYAMTAAETYGVEHYIAEALWCLGDHCYQIGDYRSSYDHLQKAYWQLFNKLSPGDLKMQRLRGLCGIDLVRAEYALALGEYRDKDKLIAFALDVEAKCANLSDDLIHGRSLISVGHALRLAGRYQEALSYLDRAKAMLKGVAVGNGPFLTTAYSTAAEVQYREGRVMDALATIEEAWKLAQTIEIPFLQAAVTRNLCVFLFRVDRDAEAWHYLKMYLTNSLHLGNQSELAIALHYMGYGYLRQGDYRNAHSAYEAATERYVSTGAAWGVGICKDNIARIEQKLADPNSGVGFTRPSYENNKSLYYPISANDQLPASDVAISSL